MPVLSDLPPDLAPQCRPLAWLLGRWQGRGRGDYPTIEPFQFMHEVTFEQNGKPFLTYHSRSWLLNDDDSLGRPLASESGFWRPLPGTTPDEAAHATGEMPLEVMLSHPTGFAEIWIGHIEGTKIELHTDVVARTSSAKEYTAGHRMYGQVESDLLWAFDMAAMGEPLQSHLWARLVRVPENSNHA